MKFYEGNSLPERVHSNCSVSGSLWPQAPSKCLCLGEPGMAHPSSPDQPACVSWRGSGRALGAPLPQAHWWVSQLEPCPQSSIRVGDTVDRSVCPGGVIT
ncbi:unnamed protein product [Rangifer tarandus platyrhynchus]|uniref:Uncharacterized protein n=1 Tax=Rangifer tarandus platyrhynchus TaxID=3082113 RepID=A0ABN8ZFK1_RANTA|nr:unnamed protein product [Rangifer tarandus platyrhynchus]